MVEDAGGLKLVNTLKRNVERLISIRTYINQGYIPGRVKYSLTEFKSKLPEDDYLRNMSDFTLKKHIATALDCSLRDLMYIKLILENNTGYDNASCEMTHMKVINRATLSYDMLLSDIGVQDDIERMLYRLNRALIDSLDSVRKESDMKQLDSVNKLDEIDNDPNNIFSKSIDIESLIRE